MVSVEDLVVDRETNGYKKSLSYLGDNLDGSGVRSRVLFMEVGLILQDLYSLERS